MNLAEKFSKIPIVSLVFLALFIVFSIVELVFAFVEKEKLRRIVKPFCLLTLGVALATCLPNHPLIYIGAFFGLAGDLLVIRKFHGAFTLGALAFFLGDICYIVEGFNYIAQWQIQPWAITTLSVFFLTVFISGNLLIFRKYHHRFEALGASLYYATLFTMLPIMVFFMAKFQFNMLFAVIGTAFFISSDILIYYFRVKPKIKRYDFYIMLTYLIAQFGIAAGFIFTLL